MDVFLDIQAEKDDIIKAGCELFKLMFHGKPPKDLGDLRFDTFRKWAAAGSIKHEKLPPDNSSCSTALSPGLSPD